MATLSELTQKRENLITEMASIAFDLNDYIENPLANDVLDVDNFKNQYQYCLFELKKIDEQIKLILNSQIENLTISFTNLESLLDIQLSKLNFDPSYLPKNHYSLSLNSK